MKTDKIAIVTMAHGYPQMLSKWCAHYGAIFGAENLFILSHGSGPDHRAIAGDANVIALPRTFSRAFGRARVRMVGRVAAGLLEIYQNVVITDVDEFLCVAPDVSDNLLTYLQGRAKAAAIAPLGFQLRPETSRFDWSAPALSQRFVASLRGHACKPTIISAPQDFLPGFHAIKAGPFEVDPNLMLFHLKHVDHDAFHAHYAAVKSDVEAIWTEDEKSGAKKNKPQAAWADAELNWRKEAEKYSYQNDPVIFDPKTVAEGGYSVVQNPDKGWWSVKAPKFAQKPFALPLNFRTLV